MRTRPSLLALWLAACGPSEEPPLGGGGGPLTAGTRNPTSGGSGEDQTSQAETSADGTEGTGGGSTNVECDAPFPTVQIDGASLSGFEICSDGFVHRAEAVPCFVPEPPPLCESLSGNGSCATSAECSEAPNGACVDDGVLDPAIAEGCHCEYACQTDDDCGDGQVCACTTVVGTRPRCIPAGCVDSSDCEGLCGLDEATGDCGGSTFALDCLDPGSDCRPGSCPPVPDCSGEGMVSPPCVITIAGWACQPVECSTTCG